MWKKETRAQVIDKLWQIVQGYTMADYINHLN